MPTNAEAAALLREIADLLDVLGERFKPEAYRRAARSVESLTEGLAAVAARDELRTIPGVGEAIAEKLREYLDSGHLAYYDRLVKEVPPGVVEIMRLPGLGPKTARRFWTELGIEGPKELAAAIEAGKLAGVKGFGPKKIEQIRATLVPAAAPAGPARRPIDEIYPLAARLHHDLVAVRAVERAETAGSFRRAQESIGDLDLLATSTEPERVFDAFSALPEIQQVRLRGPTKETVILTNGLQVDLRVVEPAAYGAALQYFTGSKDHNVRLRTLARDRGLKINEYGVFRGEERIAGRTEEEVYAALGLSWIPPELRVDRGEIDRAAAGTLPTLVADADLRGELHLHLPESGTAEAFERAVTEAKARRYAYVGVVVAGVDANGHTFRRDLPERTAPGVRVLRVVEVGPGPVPESLADVPCDYRLLRPVDSVPKGTLPETVRGIAHVGSATGTIEAIRAWIARAAELGAFIEIGPGPERLDSTAGQVAVGSHVPLAVPTGLGAPPFDATRPVGLGFARRAGAERSGVANAGDAPAGRDAKPRKPRRAGA
jgi:DNA polymerase (family X)